MNGQVSIRTGLPEENRHQAAEIYYAAFREKLSFLTSSPSKTISILTQIFNPQRALTAFIDNKIVGIAGLHYDRKVFTAIQLAVFTREIGWLHGTAAFTVFHIFDPTPPDDMLRIECLAVHPSERGKGIGTQMLSAIYKLAKEKGKQSVTLEVVDTNPEALRLYLREGFKVVRTHHYPYLRRLAGFSAAHVMVRRLG